MWLTPTRQPFASAIGGCSRAPSGPSTTSIFKGSLWAGSSRVSPGTAMCVRSTRAWPRSLRCPTAARSSTLLAALASPFAPCAKSSVCATSATTSRRRCCDAPAGGGDNAAAAVGVGVVRERLISSSIGTSGVLFAHRDTFARDPSGRVHAFCHAVPGAYHLMAVTLSAGGSLHWWRERFAGSADFESLGAEAAEVEAGAEGLVFLPYLTGERSPHLDARARGAFVGLTARHGRPSPHPRDHGGSGSVDARRPGRDARPRHRRRRGAGDRWRRAVAALASAAGRHLRMPRPAHFRR